MALFVVAAVHCALMAMVLKVAGTMVSGWQVFGLARFERADSAASVAAQTAALTAGYAPVAPPTEAMAPSSRRAALAAAVAAPAEVLASSGEQGGRSDERRTHVTHVSGGGIAPLGAGSAASRAKGIGSRFRASNDTGRKAAQEMIR
jgi:type IV secretion system protein VirB6